MAVNPNYHKHSVKNTIPAHIAYLSLGSNQGERLEQLHEAIRLIHQNKIQILKMSPIYETSAVGFGQPSYLNAVLQVKTNLPPFKLLVRLKKIEQALGRKPGGRWEKRPIDLDIIFYGSRRVHSKKLKIPHPQFRYRRFVLIPLLNLEPRLKDPESGKSIRQILRELTSPRQRVRLKKS